MKGYVFKKIKKQQETESKRYVFILPRDVCKTCSFSFYDVYLLNFQMTVTLHIPLQIVIDIINPIMQSNTQLEASTSFGNCTGLHFRLNNVSFLPSSAVILGSGVNTLVLFGLELTPPTLQPPNLQPHPHILPPFLSCNTFSVKLPSNLQ